MVVQGEHQRKASGISDTDEATQLAGLAVVEKAGAALAAGITPDSPAADPIVNEVVGLFASAAGRHDNLAYRAELAAHLEMFSDRRVERYWQFIGLVNGWPEQPSLMPAYEWFMTALKS
jgi:hypothetical protein